jgi:hypothetical protein
MTKLTRRVLVVGFAGVLQLFGSAVVASPITLYFSGTIEAGSYTYDGATGVSGNWDGSAFTGQMIRLLRSLAQTTLPIN